jgi:hypothetical protein
MGRFDLTFKAAGVLTEIFALSRMGLDVAGMIHDKAVMARLHGDLLDHAKNGAGQVVMVLPGLGADDAMTAPLREFLNQKGFRAYGWDCGTNLGPRAATLQSLRERIEALSAAHGGTKIKLVGHSMGGLIAREASRDLPHLVSQTVTLGSPFSIVNARDGTSAKTLSHIFEMMSDENRRIARDEALLRRMGQVPGVPTTSIYTRKDGFVDWRACINPKHTRAENVEVPASHCGLIYHPQSWLVVADRLAQKPSQWKAFQPEAYEEFPLPFLKDQAHHALDIPRAPRTRRNPAAVGLFVA